MDKIQFYASKEKSKNGHLKMKIKNLIYTEHILKVKKNQKVTHNVSFENRNSVIFDKCGKHEFILQQDLKKKTYFKDLHFRGQFPLLEFPVTINNSKKCDLDDIWESLYGYNLIF